MKFPFQLLVLLLLVGCNKNKENCSTAIVCKNGTMKDAWYVYGQDTIMDKTMVFEEKFQIVVDTMRQPTNFVSFSEKYAREEFSNVDAEYYLEDEELLSDEEKEKRYEQIRLEYGLEADTIHEINNNKELLVWIVNNSKDTVQIQMQDWSFICIKEAKNECNEWKPIEYWEFSFCGNSYYYEEIPPKNIKQFVTNRFEGDFWVEIRFKLLGKKEFYHSNSFWGTIDKCSFQIDSTEKIEKYMLEKPLILVR